MEDYNHYMQWIGAAFVTFCAAVLLANIMMNVKSRTYQDNVNTCELNQGWFDSLVGVTEAACGQNSKVLVNATEYGFPFTEKTIYTSSQGGIVGVECSGGVLRNTRSVRARFLKKDATACPSRAADPGGGLGSLLVWPNFWFYFVLSGSLYFVYVYFAHKRAH